ncbi:MAG: N-acetylmuramoyl-L-alanine amidase [Deltaproteobacteria bacterium]|nr:N-acetylmuramoyl-L-alanine amidase [Deltaproteobacteria bacterium]
MAEPTDHPGAIPRPSGNHDERPPGTRVDAVVIHYTDLPLAETLELLCRPGHSASTHYVIDRDGALFQLVPESRRAWHAGMSRLDGRERVNGFSIGVDLVYGPTLHDGYTESQYARLEDLLSGLSARHLIPPQRVVGHEHVAWPPGRKSDPGPLFDWARIRRHLVGTVLRS